MPSQQEMYDALVERQGKELTDRLGKACIAVCGLGGLGSHIAICLARAGIGRLILIDFDTVDISNLHRQQYRASQVGMKKTQALEHILQEIAPYVVLETHTVKMTEENTCDLVKEADIVCEAFDDAQSKAMLVNTVLETFPKKYVIAGSGMAGIGSTEELCIKHAMKHLYICGDGRSDVKIEGSLVASRVMVCAGMQAHTAIRILAGEE